MKKLFSKNYWAMKGLALLVLVMVGGGGDVIGQSFTGSFSFAGTNGDVTTLAYNGTQISNLTVSSLVKTGVDNSTSSNNFRATNFSTGSTNAGAAGGNIDLNKYFEFTITSTSGLSILNPTLTFGVGRSGTGPRRFQWRWNIDSYASPLNVTTINSSITHSSGIIETPDANAGYTGNIINATTSNRSSITFRFYPYGAEATTGTGGLQGNLTFGGTLTETNYYSNSTGNLNDVISWGTNTDGTGTTPSNFTNANQYFNVRNNATPTIGADWTISGSNTKLIIDNGSTLTIPLTKTLNISSTSTIENNGNITNNGTLTLKSDINGTASIGNSAGTITGNITVERFIPANRKYRFLAAPVVGATAVQWRDNGGTTPGIGTHITGGSVGSNFDQSTLNAPSAFWYNEVNAGNLSDVSSGATSDPGWTAFTNGNTQDLTNGKGFRIFVRGDRTLSLTGSIPTANNTTLSVTGSYPANSVSIATTKTNSNTNSGFNLVGNPYPATIDWNTVTKGANISDTYSTFNPSSNSYVMWNRLTGDATRYIASGQAFFVQQTGLTGGITIAEANKVSNAAGNFFRNKLTDHLKVSMKYDSANYDAAFIHFREDALNEFDNYDGLKFQNAGVNIASVGANGKRYNINSLGSLNQTTEIPLSVLGSTLTNFELKFEDVESFKNYELYLIDHYLNKMLLLSNGFTYPIELSSDSASVKDGRFKVVFVQKATGIQNNNKNANAFILYPNPAANTIHLLLDAKNTYNENVSFEIFNQLGARLQQGILDFTAAKDQTISIDNLAQGSYFIKLQSKSIHQTIKFIK